MGIIIETKERLAPRLKALLYDDCVIKETYIKESQGVSECFALKHWISPCKNYIHILIIDLIKRIPL